MPGPLGRLGGAAFGLGRGGVGATGPAGRVSRVGRLRRGGQDLLGHGRMVSRRSIEVFWSQRNASASVMPRSAWSSPLARSRSLRTSSRSRRPVTSESSAVISWNRLTATSMAGHQVGLGERLDQVGHGAGVAGPPDQVALGERGQDDDRGESLRGDLLGGRDAVQARHLDVHDDEVRAELLGQVDGGRAVADLASDEVALLLQHFFQVQPDEGLVFGDNHAQGLAHGLTLPKPWAGLAAPPHSPSGDRGTAPRPPARGGDRAGRLILAVRVQI